MLTTHFYPSSLLSSTTYPSSEVTHYKYCGRSTSGWISMIHTHMPPDFMVGTLVKTNVSWPITKPFWLYSHVLWRFVMVFYRLIICTILHFHFLYVYLSQNMGVTFVLSFHLLAEIYRKNKHTKVRHVQCYNHYEYRHPYYPVRRKIGKLSQTFQQVMRLNDAISHRSKISQNRIERGHKNLRRHTAHTIVSWINDRYN